MLLKRKYHNGKIELKRIQITNTKVPPNAICPCIECVFYGECINRCRDFCINVNFSIILEKITEIELELEYRYAFETYT